MSADSKILVTVVWVEKNEKKTFAFSRLKKPTLKDLTLQVKMVMLIPVGETELIFDMDRPLSDFHNKTFIAIYWSNAAAKHHPAAFQIQKEVLSVDAKRKIQQIMELMEIASEINSSDDE